MRIERIRRWQWILIGLTLGLLIGFVRNMYTDDVLKGYGDDINTPGLFETGLRRTTKLEDGTYRHNFDQLRVFDVKIQDPQRPNDVIRTYAVAGKYHNNDPKDKSSWETSKDGKLMAVWRPRYYPAPYPYKPSNSRVPPPKGEVKRTFADTMEVIFQKLNLKEPDLADSVLTHLRALKAAGEIDFTYEWWKARRANTSIWTIGCVVAIGFVWPTIVNLIAFGRLTAPPQEKSINLRKVSASANAEKPKNVMTEQDMDELRRMEEKLEASLRASASTTPAGPAAATVAAPIRKLEAKTLELTPTTSAEDENKEFEAKPDDYYPVERHHAPKK